MSRPWSMSVSPMATARWLSTQSRTSYGGSAQGTPRLRRAALGECVVGLKPRGSDHNLQQPRDGPTLGLDASRNERLPAVGQHDHVTRLDVRGGMLE